MRTLAKLALAALLLVALAVGGLVLGLDAAVRAAVEKGGSHALGVPTRLESASLSPFDGELTLEGLEIANPPGFEERPFLALERAHTVVDLGSLREDVVRVETIELGNVRVLLQRRDGRSNYAVILDHIGGEGGPSESDSGDEGPRVHVDRLVIRDVHAEFDLLPIGGELTRASVTIPELVLEDLGNSEEGASVAEITARVVEALLMASLEAGGRVLSPELLVDLKDGLAGLGVKAIDVGEVVVDEVSDALKKVGGEAGKALEGLRDVLPGGKKD